MKLKGKSKQEANLNFFSSIYLRVLSKQCYPEPTKHMMDTLFLVYQNLLSPSTPVYILCNQETHGGHVNYTS